MLLDSPVVDHCFDLEAAVDPLRPETANGGAVHVTFLNMDRRVSAGGAMSVRLLVVREGTDEPVEGLQDVGVIAMRAPGRWQMRDRARAVGEGVYEVEVPADEAGAYVVTVAIPSLGLDYTDLPFCRSLKSLGPSIAKNKGRG